MIIEAEDQSVSLGVQHFRRRLVGLVVVFLSGEVACIVFARVELRGNSRPEELAEGLCIFSRCRGQLCAPGCWTILFDQTPPVQRITSSYHSFQRDIGTFTAEAKHLQLMLSYPVNPTGVQTLLLHVPHEYEWGACNFNLHLAWGC